MENINKDSSTISEGLLDPIDIVNEYFILQKEVKVLLYMPKDFCDLYQIPLANRLESNGINLVIKTVEDLNDNTASFDDTLSYNCSLPANESKDKLDNAIKKESSAHQKDFFKIEGVPSKQKVTPFPRNELYYTEIEKRYLSLNDAISALENNKHFLKLAGFQFDIQQKLQEIQKFKKEIESLSKTIKTIEGIYYQILPYFLEEAINNVLQLVTLGEVMKRYIKVLIIDDQGDHGLEQLANEGFRKRLLTNMTQNTFEQLYNEFKHKYQEKYPDKSISNFDFYSKCSIFEDHQIVLNNPWRLENGGLPVEFFLIKSPELSRKEIRKKNEDPAKVTAKIDQLNQERQKLKLQLETSEIELQEAEQKGHLAESAYVTLSKKRKRMIKTINKVTLELKEAQKVILEKPELTIYRRDLLLSLNNKKIINSIKSKSSLNPADLEKMANLITQKKEKEKQIRLLRDRINISLKKMKSYAVQYPIDPKKNHQQILGTHALNKLEMTVLGCGIITVNKLVNVYRGPYYSETHNKTEVNWNDELVSQASIFMASRRIKIDASIFQRFFRIDMIEISERIENSPSLPTSVEFNNDAYDLFIINYDSYRFQELVDCLKLRNQSQRPFVPVLILDSANQIADNKQKVILDLLVGLKKDSNKTLSLFAPTYRIDTLKEERTLYPVICELMGIDENTIQSLFKEAENLADIDSESEDNYFSNPLTLMPESEPKDITPIDQPSSENDEPVLSNSCDENISTVQISLDNVTQEETYTLGSIFSFSDETKTSVPGKKEKESAPLEIDPKTENNNQSEKSVNQVLSEDAKPSVDPESDNDNSPETDQEIYESDHLF